MKLRLLCSQVLKELLGQGIDVSAWPSTPLPHNPVTSSPPWVPLLLSTGSRLGGQGAASKQGSDPPDRYLSPQYEKVLKLTADARFGE